MTKVCALCGKSYSGDARRVYCSQLCKGRAKEARIKANPEMLKKRLESKRRADRARHRRDRQKRNAACRSYYEKNADLLRAKALEAYRKNPQLVVDRNRRWRSENRDRANSYQRRWRLENPEKARAASRASAQRRRGASAHRYILSEELDSKMQYWGRRCWMCGAPPESWDHVKPVSKGGPDILANLRPACMPCNRAKSAKWLGARKTLSIFRQGHQEIL